MSFDGKGRIFRLHAALSLVLAAALVLVAAQVFGFDAQLDLEGQNEDYPNVTEDRPTGIIEDVAALRARFSPTVLQIFSDCLYLIARRYAGDISEQDLFSDAMNELALTALPQCVELLQPPQECKGNIKVCFLDTVKSIAECSNSEIEPVLTLSLKILLRKLDHNSALLDSRMLKELKISTTGRFGGIGLVVTVKGGEYVVISSFEGSPAHSAGIAPGDVVLEIDHSPIRGLPLFDVLGMVRGRVGSTISMLIRPRSGAGTRDVRLRREMMRVPPVRHLMLASGIGYLRIVNFQANTSRDAARSVKKLVQSAPGGLKGLVLDLRGNPGGLFDEAIKVADLFLDEGTITIVRGRLESLNKDWQAHKGGVLLRAPIVVLIDRGTASAAEIVAAALKGVSGVAVMGERSFGKASVQGVFPISSGMALRLTTAHYYTPDGGDIDGTGIEPDVKISEPEEIDPAEAFRMLDRTDAEQDHAITTAHDYLTGLRSPTRSRFPTLF
jgi:carboxyl-terminal processing protease